MASWQLSQGVIKLQRTHDEITVPAPTLQYVGPICYFVVSVVDQIFISMRIRIRIRIQEAKPKRIQADPNPDKTF
jgi:hypothetical protein